MKKYLLILILLLIPVNVEAREGFTIRCGRTVFGEYDSFDCRIAVQSNFSFDKVEFEITTSDGIGITGVRSNHQALWAVNHSDNSVSAYIRQNRRVTGLQEFGIILFRAEGSGIQEIEVNNVVLTNTNNNTTREISGIIQEISVLSSDNRLREIRIDGEPIQRFTLGVARHDIEIPTDATEIEIEATPLNNQATISGTGTIELSLDYNNFVIPIVVTSATDTRRVYILHIRREGTRLPMVTASNIELLNNGTAINFGFRSGTFEYDIELPTYINSLELNVELDNEYYSLVPNYGSREINLEYGDNIILIKVINAEGERSIYSINIRRAIAHKSENNFLQSISIEGYRLNERFNRRVRQYTLSIRRGVGELEITAVPEHRNATITILGNENLHDGSVIRIVVTAENGSTRTYEITIRTMIFTQLQIIGIITLTILGIITYRQLRKISRAEVLIPEIPKLKEVIAKPIETAEPKVVTKKATTKKKVLSVKKPVKPTSKPTKKKVVKIAKPTVEKPKAVPKKATTKKKETSIKSAVETKPKTTKKATPKSSTKPKVKKAASTTPKKKSTTKKKTKKPPSKKKL